jgi:ABC-type phosphate transport system substrate-binding protein
MNTSIFRRLGAIGLFVASAAIAGASPVIIANKSLDKEKLDASTVKSVFLGKKVAWDTGGRVMLAVLRNGAVADDFFKASVDMNTSGFNNLWRRLAMTGGGTAPKSFESEEELRKYVAETPGAVGFVDSANVDASVVVLTPSA